MSKTTRWRDWWYFVVQKEGDIIGIRNYTGSSKGLAFPKSGIKALEEAKRELEGLHEYNSVFDELEKADLFAAENSIHFDNEMFIQASSLISEIAGKQEIMQRLNSLSYSITWLNSAISSKDNYIINKSIETILKNDYSSISSIISELDSLKSSMGKLEALHENLFKSGLSLDVKALLEQDFREKRKKLNGLYEKQKKILLALSGIFVKLSKDEVIKKKASSKK